MNNTKSIFSGSICWLHFPEGGHLEAVYGADYAYISNYVKEREEMRENEELYVKVAIKDITYKYGKLHFSMEVVNKDGSCMYPLTCNDADRLTPIEWKNPAQIKWTKPPSIFGWIKMAQEQK